MTTGIFILILAIFLGLNLGLLWFFVGRKKEEKKDDSGMVFLQNQLNELNRTVDSKLGESAKEMQSTIRDQFSESAKIIKDVTAGLTKLDETNKQVVSFADQLKSLQDVLKNPKQRGVLGEYYLETVLKNVLPPDRFQMQYAFENGEIVDAVVYLDRDKVLPIDSKFSLENYNRLVETRDPVEREKHEKAFKQDLKNRIDETAKYIRPAENTMDFAFMFIPSEGIYYDLLIGTVGTVKSRDLIEYAFQQKKVIIVSPTSFMAYLQTVLQGLRSLQIEEQAKDIQKRVGELGRHMKTYEEFMNKLGNTLGTTVNHYNKASKELGKIDKDVMRITGESPELDVLTVDGPSEE
ncbi:DNA recombination protein RmuC [Candidatus Campbellbacteria bacterium CG22_combo_CG10-13_8_21_14_all_36_13]|uniref:DNA recombination protein RmuC n=1 Tax=Candidatus Campbellbacteria bacterium CG22_combo_CG10-13_8_21_14_all_36_13 TaxID=1974529 RepID=A0A2H0DYW3_9BACT|nr:MAG: DNA recombination protein RmuC [Candidatus Campbellbacteria bacterium CG22_combo_CG10-13_8_21_14_all_36_13]